ncbi:MAG TPA: hypothetical protein VG711_07285 [Phycisphaerales bacterium]|nr:hypothetical protein [Phycisphaerales bacterium]
MKTLAIAVCSALFSAGISNYASAVNVCGITDALDFAGIDPLPFGGEYLGAGPSGGTIIGADVEIKFTTSGTFDAANLSMGYEICDAEDCVGVAWSGPSLGWSGQGTFTASFHTNNLNGLIFTDSTPFSTTLLEFGNLCPGCGPFTGTFNILKISIQYGPCPTGDINHDLSVNIDDLTAVILNWGACHKGEDCPADLNLDGQVNIDDLTTIILNWHDYCANCK